MALIEPHSLDAVPEELRKLPRWVVYRLEPDPKNPEKLKKSPYRAADPTKGAASTRPEDWSDLAAALDTVSGATNLDGVGLVIRPPYIGVDLDHCLEDSSHISEFAAEVVKRLDSYTEWSPSHRGLHVWIRGAAPKDPRDGSGVKLLSVKTPQIEVYPTDRYFTVTGKSFHEIPKEVRQLDAATVAWLYARGAKPEERSTASASGTRGFTRLERLTLLLRGEWRDLNFTSQSEADLELCCYFAEGARGDVSAVERLFRDSKMYRSPADGKQEGYPRLTAEKACALYVANPPKQQPVVVDPNAWPELFPTLAEWKVEPARELVKDLLIRDGVHVFAGLFESYKTIGAIELSAALLDRRPAFDYFPLVGGDEFLSKIEILYLCPDMPPSLFLEYAAPFGLKRNPRFRGLNPVGDVLVAIDDPRLERAVQNRVLFLDTMFDYARFKNAWQSDEWIGFMQKLRRLINVHGCLAVVLIAHPTKSGARSKVIDATEFLKDSVTFGGKIDVGLAFRKIDRTSKVLIERIKGRGFKKPMNFTVTVNDDDGNSNLDRGRFPICDRPGECHELSTHLKISRGGPKSQITEEDKDTIRRLLGERKTNTQIGNEIGRSKNTVRDWIEKYKLDEGLVDFPEGESSYDKPPIKPKKEKRK